MECCLAKMTCNKSHLGIVYGYHSGGSSPQHLGGGALPHAMASAVARVCNGGLGRSPQRGPGAELLMVRGSEGKSPMKLKHFWFFDAQWKPQICPLF